MRVKPSRKPPSSTIEIETAHLFLAASALAGGEQLLHVVRCQILLGAHDFSLGG